MYQRILIPLDGSPLAEQALPCALNLARQAHVKLSLLRVIPPFEENEMGDNGHFIFVDELVAMARREAEGYLLNMTRSIQAQGLDVTARVVYGQPAEVILDSARTMRADLIAICTHGRSGLSRWVYGSVADRVLRGASTPVLLTRATQETQTDVCTFTRILVPLDGSDLAERVLSQVRQVAHLFEAELILARVVTMPHSLYISPESLPIAIADMKYQEQCALEYLQGWQCRLQADGLKTRVALAKPPVAEALLELAQTERVNLIALCTHGRSGIGRWVYGSVADRLLQAAHVPILLVRATNGANVAEDERAVTHAIP